MTYVVKPHAAALLLHTPNTYFLAITVGDITINNGIVLCCRALEINEIIHSNL
jgi:hypothetical protein